MDTTLYGSNVGTTGGMTARAIRDGLARTARGELVTVTRFGRQLDHEALRQWFRDKIDGLINLKAGLREDGAPRKQRCACAHCLGRCTCSIRKIAARGGYVCGYGCREPWGGRRWSGEWQMSAWRDAWRVRDKRESRVAIHSFETDMARARLAHLVSERDF